MNENLEFVISEKIFLKNHLQYDEKWLQNRIEENPELLGLGELEVIQRERIQSSKGRLDFLLRDTDKEMLFEVEIQLGKTDPSHIIRTIEYWDIEKRKNPNYEHRAVLIAEDITNRFFNVISLMNRSIPVIAIQLNALKVNDKITLNFTKVLDIYELPEDEITSKIETLNKDFWRKKTPPESFKISNVLIEIFKSLYTDVEVTYNRWHIALGTSIRNCLWLKPRKSNFVRVEIKISDENVEDIVNILSEIGLTPKRNKNRVDTTNLAFPIKLIHVENNKDIISRVFQEAIKTSS